MPSPPIPSHPLPSLATLQPNYCPIGAKHFAHKFFGFSDFSYTLECCPTSVKKSTVFLFAFIQKQQCQQENKSRLEFKMYKRNLPPTNVFLVWSLFSEFLWERASFFVRWGLGWVQMCVEGERSGSCLTIAK
jgi:hypothetical protein